MSNRNPTCKINNTFPCLNLHPLMIETVLTATLDTVNFTQTKM